jgi:hypothetical protein
MREEGSSELRGEEDYEIQAQRIQRKTRHKACKFILLQFVAMYIIADYICHHRPCPQSRAT